MNKNFTQEEWDKLPKWAQYKIANLITDIKDRDTLIRQLNGESDSPVRQYAAGGFSEATVHYLHPQNPVVFRLPKMEGVNSENEIQVRIKGGQLQIMSSGYPTQLAVLPQSSNVVNIETVNS